MSNGLWFFTGVVVGAIIGIIGPLIANYIRYLCTKPNLEILEDEPHKSQNYVHHSIRIKNTGRSVAINCNAVLTIAAMTQNDVIDSMYHSYITTDAFRPIRDESLCWALQILSSTGDAVNPAFLSIFPGSTRLVELCGVSRQSLEIEIPSEMGWRSKRVVLRGNREYEVELKIFAENVSYNSKKHRAKFKLVPDIEKKDIIIQRIDC